MFHSHSNLITSLKRYVRVTLLLLLVVTSSQLQSKNDDETMAQGQINTILERTTTSQAPSTTLGRQVSVELYDCDPALINDLKYVEKIMIKAAKAANATIVAKKFHQFAPQGVSGAVILAESHYAIHTWPEHKYCAVDAFTCGDHTNNAAGIAVMQEGFKAQKIQTLEIQRGLDAEELKRVEVINNSDNLKRTRSAHADKAAINVTQEPPEVIEDQYAKVDAWGMETVLDMKKCNPETIRSAEKIKEYVYKLCDLIEMKRFQDCVVVYFGEDEKVAGYSMTQLIETSLISGHFANDTNNAYLNIFSCKAYDTEVAAQFTKEFFEAEDFEINVLLRK